MLSNKPAAQWWEEQWEARQQRRAKSKEKPGHHHHHHHHQHALSNGVLFPAVHFGTAGLGAPTQVEAAVRSAFRFGFTAVDTAQAIEWYDEEAVARVVREVEQRDEDAEEIVSTMGAQPPPPHVFVTTKLHPRDHGYESCARRVTESFGLFGRPIDLFLLHYPACYPGLCEQTGTWRESWRALEEAYHSGTVRAIGVSNFALSELEELLRMTSNSTLADINTDTSTETDQGADTARGGGEGGGGSGIAPSRVAPHVVQNYMDPFAQARPVRSFCKRHGIHFTSYSTLGGQWNARGGGAATDDQTGGRNIVLTSPVIASVATRSGMSPSLVVWTWALQRGVSVLPRSANDTHIGENARLLPPRKTGRRKGGVEAERTGRGYLTEKELKLIDRLDGRVDGHWNCPAWAGGGECRANPTYMATSCRFACEDVEDARARSTETITVLRGRERGRGPQATVRSVLSKGKLMLYAMHVRRRRGAVDRVGMRVVNDGAQIANATLTKLLLSVLTRPGRDGDGEEGSSIGGVDLLPPDQWYKREIVEYLPEDEVVGSRVVNNGERSTTNTATTRIAKGQPSGFTSLRSQDFHSFGMGQLRPAGYTRDFTGHDPRGKCQTPRAQSVLQTFVFVNAFDPLQRKFVLEHSGFVIRKEATNIVEDEVAGGADYNTNNTNADIDEWSKLASSTVRRFTALPTHPLTQLCVKYPFSDVHRPLRVRVAKAPLKGRHTFLCPAMSREARAQSRK